MAKAASGMNALRLVNLNNLRIFPVTRFAIFSFDINIGLFDFLSLYFAVLLIGLIAGAGGFTISISIAFLFIIFLISLVYFVHILGELVKSIKMLLSSLPKFLAATISLVLLVSLYIMFFRNISFKDIVNNNPLSWNGSSIFSLTIFKETNWIFDTTGLNVLFSVAGLILVVSIKTLHARLFSANKIQTAAKMKKIGTNRLKIISLFPEQLQPYLEKDLKYLLRSSRSVSAVILELLLLVFLGYMHFIHAKAYSNFYVALSFIVIFPAIVWDFYLSNSWGLEKKGFGFYLYSNADFSNLIPSKNLSFLLLKLPVILVISVGFSFIFSFQYLLLIILLSFLLNITTLSFTNIVSIQNPYPVDFKESSFSKRRQQRVSWIGFIGVLTYFALTGTIIFIQYTLHTDVVFYLITAGIIVIVYFIYKKLLSRSSFLLYSQKELIYKELIKT